MILKIWVGRFVKQKQRNILKKNRTNPNNKYDTSEDPKVDIRESLLESNLHAAKNKNLSKYAIGVMSND